MSTTETQQTHQTEDSQKQSQDDEERQKKLDQKMEEMRRKNALLRKRYEEIEADKRNANLNSKLVAHEAEEGGDYSDDSDAEPEFPRGPCTEKVNRHRPSDPEAAAPIRQGQERPSKNRDRQPTNAAAKVPYQHQNRQRDLPLHDAPPPDPKFHFLDDPDRRGFDGDSEDANEWKGRRTGRGDRGEFRRGGGRPAFEGNRGFGNYDSPSGKPGGFGRGRGRRSAENAETIESGNRVDYSNWREERTRIDAERLARQQTSSGQWKREWDADKQFQWQDNQKNIGERRNQYQHQHVGNRRDDDRQQYQNQIEFQRSQCGRGGFGGQGFRNGENADQDSNISGRRVTGVGRGFRVEVQQDKHDERPAFSSSGGRGRGRGRGFSSNRQPYTGGFGGGAVNDAGLDRDHARSYQESPTRFRGRGGFQPTFQGGASNQGESVDQWPALSPDRRKIPTESPLHQDASVDSSEYASPEPQHSFDKSTESAGPKTTRQYDEEEEEQWEDVEDGSGHADGYYYDELHCEPAGGTVEKGIVYGATGHEDELALAAKLSELEKQVRENPEPDFDAAALVTGEFKKTEEQALCNQAKVVEMAAAMAVEAKEINAGRRRATTDVSATAGPDLPDCGHENEIERARHESMDQIERDMIARLDENIQAVEAALGASEEDLELLLSGSGKAVVAPLLEGADEEELLRDDGNYQMSKETSDSKSVHIEEKKQEPEEKSTEV